MTDFGKIDNYAAFVEQDPFRNGLHYPAVISELGELQNKKLLDVGCGDGRLPRKLAEAGANVVGYDMALKKIEEARELGGANIEYQVATPQSFSHEERFDDATSVLVLPYAESVDELTQFFSSTCNHLVTNGRFISIVYNPDFTAFDQVIGSRRFTKQGGNDVQVEFLNPNSKETQFTSVLHQHSQDNYEQAAEQGGFNSVIWKKLFATREAIDQLGESFWKQCHEEQPYAALIATRK